MGQTDGNRYDAMTGRIESALITQAGIEGSQKEASLEQPDPGWVRTQPDPARPGADTRTSTFNAKGWTGFIQGILPLFQTLVAPRAQQQPQP